mmetsp:Transcript_18601/g.34661  ORF Transcript_18601/g.34661 Transcript_18601/m.34661 type:complete len:96 (+) Transcript_18601:380-667(+)
MSIHAPFSPERLEIIRRETLMKQSLCFDILMTAKMMDCWNVKAKQVLYLPRYYQCSNSKLMKTMPMLPPENAGFVKEVGVVSGEGSGPRKHRDQG